MNREDWVKCPHRVCVDGFQTPAGEPIQLGTLLQATIMENWRDTGQPVLSDWTAEWPDLEPCDPPRTTAVFGQWKN